MARVMRAIRSGAAGVAMALWAAAAAAAPVPQDAAQQAASDDREAPEDYDWIDRADALWDAIGDAPPDYSFAFDQGEPWAWETADGYWVVVEDGPDGMRSYYFEPGAMGPFLAREAEHSFGYDDGEVAMIYDAGGGAMPRARAVPFFDEGAQLYDRGVALLRALRQRDWQPVDTTAWVDTSLVLIALQSEWDQGRLRHAGWRRHRALPQVIAWHQRWDSEHRRRADAAERFRRWREGGYQGKPPGRPDGWVHGPKRPGRGDGRPGWQGRPPRGGAAGPDAIRDPALVVTPAGGGRPIGRPRPGGPVQAPRVDDNGAPMASPPRAPWRGNDGRPGRGPRPGAPVPGAAPATPAADAVPTPATPAAPVTQPPTRPRPWSNGGARPQPSEGARPPRGAFSRPGPRPDGPPPTRPAFTPPAAPAAPAASAPQRPAYTPPQRPAAVPAARPSAPPRAAPPPRSAPAPRPAPRVDTKPE